MCLAQLNQPMSTYLGPLSEQAGSIVGPPSTQTNSGEQLNGFQSMPNPPAPPAAEQFFPGPGIRLYPAPVYDVNPNINAPIPQRAGMFVSISMLLIQKLNNNRQFDYVLIE
jgi:hypothetical protein